MGCCRQSRAKQIVNTKLDCLALGRFYEAGKQNHICVNCDRQFIDVHDPPKGYSEELSQKQQLQMRDSWAAIAAAIERRGMSDRYQVKFHRGKYAIARK